MTDSNYTLYVASQSQKGKLHRVPKKSNVKNRIALISEKARQNLIELCYYMTIEGFDTIYRVV